MTAKFDPYEVLGLSKDCTEKDIQKAYKQQCLKWHPDKNRDNQEEAQRKFIRAREAFELLYDKERRTEHDRGAEATRVRNERQRERMEKADGKRKKFMEDLKEREAKFAQEQQRKLDELTPAQLEAQRKREEKRIKSDFEELARRLFKEAEEEMRVKNEQLSKTLIEDRKQKELNSQIGKLRVRWAQSIDVTITEADLRRIFSRFGTITEISPIVETKKRRKMCILEFSKVNSVGHDLQLSNEDSAIFKVDWQVQPKDPNDKQIEDNDVIVIEETPRETHDLESMSFDDLLAHFDSKVNAPPTKKKTRHS